MPLHHIDVHTGTRATADIIKKLKPDTVVIAVGVSKTKPDIRGADKPSVLPARAVLDGKETGTKVAVIGGGLVGCETAEYLQKQGKQVTIIEMLDDIAGKMVYAQRTILEARLKAAGITILTETVCKEITDSGVTVATKSGDKLQIEAASIVIAVGDRPNRALEHELKEKVRDLYTAGDCVKPEGIAEAVAAGKKVYIFL